jgi:transcriptional regulator with XRE-family HTH domain
VPAAPRLTNLSYWRKRRAKSIEQLAKEAHVSSVTISKIERGGALPRTAVLERLAHAREDTLSELLVDESEETAA